MTVITLPHNFTPRLYQEDFFSAMNKGGKRAILVWNRRGGKDCCAFNYLIYTAIETKGIYYYVFPTFAQGRKVLWDGMTNDGFKFLDFIPKPLIRNINNQEMKIKLSNGSLIQIIGSDNYDAIMGTNPSGCVFSEYAMQNPNAWQYIRPILDANDGWAIFVFTPRGANHAKDLFDMAENNKNWFCQKLTINETNVISQEQLDNIRAEGVSEDMIQQEWFCSFTLGIQGSYYANYLQEARDDGRITNVPYDKHQRVFTAWDLGYGDETSIIWFQIAGKEIHIIDFYENHGKEIAHYAKILSDKPYVYDRHFAPHDIDAHELGSGLSLKHICAGLGLNFTVLSLAMIKSIEAGIECVRGLFPRIWVDEKNCKLLVKAIENYRAEFDDTRQMYKPKPVHDRWSHAADSLRYACIGIRLFLDENRVIDDRDYDRMQDRFNPRFD